MIDSIKAGKTHALSGAMKADCHIAAQAYFDIEPADLEDIPEQRVRPVLRSPLQKSTTNRSKLLDCSPEYNIGG